MTNHINSLARNAGRSTSKRNTAMISHTLKKLVLTALMGTVGVAQCAVIVSTDFTGRTVSGDVASNVSYTLGGVQDPGNLTAIEDNPGDNQLDGLFDTPNAQGHFAPELNTFNEDGWSVTIPLAFATGTTSLEIEDVVLETQMFSGSGGYQTATRTTDMEVSFIGSTSGTFKTETITAAGSNGTASEDTFFSSEPTFTLSNSETWDLVIHATKSGNDGNNTGLDGFEVNGTVIPEPSTLILSAFGLVSLMRRRGIGSLTGGKVT